MRWKNKIRHCLVRVIPFFICISVFEIIVYAAITTGVWNPKVVLQSLQKSDYYAGSYDDLIDEINGIVDKTNIPITVIEEVIDFDLYYSQISRNVKDMLQGHEPQADHDITEKLSSAIDDYMIDQGISIKQKEQTVDQFIETIQAAYNRTIAPRFPKQMNQMQDQYKGDLSRITIVMGIVCLISIGLLIGLRRNHLKYLQDIASGFYGSCVAGLITMGYLMGKADLLNTEVTYYNSFIHQCMDESIQRLLGIIVFVAIVGTVLIVIKQLCGHTKR